jgi:hypothetical protein
MFWLEHLYAVCLLGHMTWAAILLHREGRRLRLQDLTCQQQAPRAIPGLSEADAMQEGV